jgi:hypothetical protein
MKEGPTLKADPFAAFRATPLFAESRQRYEPGWTTDDRVADPKFVSFSPDAGGPTDLRLEPDSPCVNAGVPIPPEWPDHLREADDGKSDMGALPRGADLWGVGVDNRIPLFGESSRSP